MNVPTFVNVKYTEQNGFLTSPMQLFNDELNTEMRRCLSDNGWTVPIVTSVQLALILAQTGDNLPPDGSLWYVKDVAPLPVYDELVVKVGGVPRKITTAAYP